MGDPQVTTGFSNQSWSYDLDDLGDLDWKPPYVMGVTGDIYYTCQYTHMSFIVNFPMKTCDFPWLC